MAGRTPYPSRPFVTTRQVPMTLKERMNDYERALIQSALQAAGGNQRRAAGMLGILPSTLSEKLKRLGMRPSGAHASDGDAEAASDLSA